MVDFFVWFARVNNVDTGFNCTGVRKGGHHFYLQSGQEVDMFALTRQKGIYIYRLFFKR